MSFKGSNIFITGINGFVGSTAAEHFLNEGAHVIGLVKDRNKKSRPDILDRCSIVCGDICDKDVLDYVLSKYEVDYVLHLAAQPIVRICNNDPYMAYQTNIMGTVNLLESCRTKIAPPKKIVVMTSVTGDTPILVSLNSETSRIDMERLWKYAEENGNKIDDEHYFIENVSCLNLEGTSCKFSDIDIVSRYKVDKDVFKVRYTGGEISVTEDHSLFVYSEDGKVVEKRGDEIEEGDLLVTVNMGNSPKKDFNCSLYSLLGQESKNTLDKTSCKYNNLKDIGINDEYVLEFMGIYLAEGSCWKEDTEGTNPHHINITINNINEHYLADIIKGFSNKYGYRFYHTTDGAKETYEFSSTELALFVRDIIGHGSRSKSLKGSWAWSLSKAQVDRLLLGYTGDAYKKHKQGHLRFTTSSKELVIDLCWLLRLHGYSSNISHVSEGYLNSRPKPIIDGREINTGEFWYLTMCKLDNILTPPKGVSKFQREPFNRCYPSSYVKNILDKSGIKCSRGLLRRRGVSRDRILGDSLEMKELFDNNNLSYSVVTGVFLDSEYSGYVYDVSAKNKDFPSFMGGTSPVLCHNSDKAYGPHAKLPYREDSELITFDSYCTSKSCQDMVARSYAMTYGLPVVVVRAGNLYGPGDLNTSRLVPRSILRLLEGDSPMLYGGVSEFVREFIFVDDIISAYEVLLEKGVNSEPYNVGGTKPQKIGHVISVMRDKIDKKIPIELEERDFKEINAQYLDATKLMSLGWAPKVELDEGLDRSIEWYKNYLINGGFSCK